jgi:hypothetical protein
VKRNIAMITTIVIVGGGVVALIVWAVRAVM